MRKRVCGLFFGVILAVALTACAGTSEGGKGPSDEEPATAAEASEAVETEKAAEESEPGSAAEDEQEEAQPDNDSAHQTTTAERWADAFCGRDGRAIAAMSSPQVRDSFLGRDLLMDEEDYGFGWSSPWPWGGAEDYRIVEETDTTAVILYYAWTSDPHVTVWRETLTWHTEGEGVIVDEEELEMMDAICTGREYADAYPFGINGTRMDYLHNGVGEALNDNAAETRDSKAYGMLYEPETAAVYLLNMLDNPDKVEAKASPDEASDGVTVDISFAEDGSTLKVRMIKPYGGDGIWIPQDFLVDNEPFIINKEEN